MNETLNVLGEPLEPCSLKPLTGFYRDGSCNTEADNPGVHAICIYATEEFLAYSKKVGNNLSTPMPQYNFAGVKAGQSCVCLVLVLFRHMKMAWHHTFSYMRHIKECLNY